MQQIQKFHDDTTQFYETLVSYLSMWMTPLKKYSVFKWMNLKENPTWEKVEETFNYLKEKNIILNDTFLFSQINTVSKIVLEEKNRQDNDWDNKLTAEKWTLIFSKMETEFLEQYIDIFKICEYLFSIPAHNANVERIFSLMDIQWSDERNRLLPETVEAILKCIVNFDFSCTEMFDYIIKHKQLLMEAKSSRKYE